MLVKTLLDVFVCVRLQTFEKRTYLPQDSHAFTCIGIINFERASIFAVMQIDCYTKCIQ